MIIAIDYDHTFSADPDLWRALVAIGKARGHEFVLVTGRSDDGAWGDEVRRAVDGLMPIVFAGNAWKLDAAKSNGWAVNVWIDDRPDGIRPPDFAMVSMKNAATARRR